MSRSKSDHWKRSQCEDQQEASSSHSTYNPLSHSSDDRPAPEYKTKRRRDVVVSFKSNEEHIESTDVTVYDAAVPTMEPLPPLYSQVTQPNNPRASKFPGSKKFSCSHVEEPNDPVVDRGAEERGQSANRRAELTSFSPKSGKRNNGRSESSLPSSYVSLTAYGYEPRFPGPLVRLNVSGTLFLVKMNTLRRDPVVYEKLLEDAEWLGDTNEYYFERDPVVFRFVHSYLRYQELHLPQNICGPLLEKELEAWGLHLGFDLQRCCLGPVMESKSKLESLRKFEKEFTEEQTKATICCPRSEHWQQVREDVWRVIGDTPKKRWLNPASGLSGSAEGRSKASLSTDDTVHEGEQTGRLVPAATSQDVKMDLDSQSITQNGFNLHKTNYIVQQEEDIDRENPKERVILSASDGIPNWRHLQGIPKRIICSRTYVSLQAIVICSLILLMILGYVANLRVPFGPRLRSNRTFEPPDDPFHVYRMYFAFDAKDQRLTRPVQAVVVLQWICVLLFTLDLVARAIFCPNILHWLRSVYTITDVVSLTPFYVESSMYAIIETFPDTEIYAQKMIHMLQVLDMVNLLKIFVAGRLFRILQRQRATRVLMYTVRTSALNMFVVLELMALCSVFFGTAVFFLDSAFDTIPRGMWWALITMATVGYGDITPSSMAGYILAVFCVVAGILLTSYTVPILVNDFLLYYSHADQLAWMRRVHSSATEKRRNERRDLLVKRRMNRVRALLKNSVVGNYSLGRSTSANINQANST
uniref:Potassium voltage-gated channel protein egl-36 n=1 Tax=Schistocephalus solidus TaxID=70667 RepID=A0A0X3PW70_SCHSO